MFGLLRWLAVPCLLREVYAVRARSVINLAKRLNDIRRWSFGEVPPSIRLL